MKISLMLISLFLLGGCASQSDSPLQPRRTVECPPSLMLICEGDNEPSSADDEMPAYERCYCRARPI